MFCFGQRSCDLNSEISHDKNLQIVHQTFKGKSTRNVLNVDAVRRRMLKTFDPGELIAKKTLKYYLDGNFVQDEACLTIRKLNVNWMTPYGGLSSKLYD